MNHFVPDFDTDDDYVQNSMNHPRKSIIGEEDDLMELLWHNGQLVIQNQRLHNNNNNNRKPSSSPVKLHGGGGEGGGGGATPPPPMHHQQQPLDQSVFIREDEMTSWLHYPLRDDDFCSDLLFSGVASASASQPPPQRAATVAPIAAPPERQTTSQLPAARPPVPSSVKPPVPSPVRPPVPSPVRPPVPSSARPPVRNFMNFSRLRGDFIGGNGRGEPGPSISKPIVRESTLVNPSATPLSTVSDGVNSRETVNFGSSSAVGASAFALPGQNIKGKAVAAMLAPVSEIPGESSKSEIEPVIVQPEATKKKTIVDDRKRKEREPIDETECRRSEETKQRRGTTSVKRTRAAEVHNLSERKRRDRINERMKALQELIPRCNKSDKASMLDEAIEYMKALQLQIQMMSMGCGMMAPMMYPGMQSYMPHMAMAMNMNQPPLMPFPNILAAQRPLPTQQTVFPGPHYPVQPDPNLSQPQYPGYMDPYQQFRGLQPTQQPQLQSQAISYPSSSRVSSSKDSEEQGNHKAG